MKNRNKTTLLRSVRLDGAKIMLPILYNSTGFFCTQTKNNSSAVLFLHYSCKTDERFSAVTVHHSVSSNHLFTALRTTCTSLCSFSVYKSHLANVCTR